RFESIEFVHLTHPRHAQLADVFCRDLIERRIPFAAVVPRVTQPVTRLFIGVANPLEGYVDRRRQHDRREDTEQDSHGFSFSFSDARYATTSVNSVSDSWPL